jgi:long-chain fatty acid transport protein
LLLPNLAISYRLGSTPVTVGIGFFTIGGTSAEFENMNVQVFGNPPIFGGTVDKERTQQRTYKMTPTIAYAVTKDLSVGVGLDVSYVDASLGIVPNTPGAVGAPFGFETKGACDRANGISLPPAGCPYDVNFSPKFGAMYRANDIVTLGLTYTLQRQFTLDHGEFVKNYSPLINPGVGKVNFDGKAFGFKTPQEVAAGIAVRPTKRLLLSTKLQWINWSQALKSITVELTHPSNSAIASDSFVLNYNWRDQYVVAVGALYDITDRLSVSGGFNYGNNPIPSTTVDPINANIIKHHLVGGAVYHFTPKFMLGSWFTYAFKNSMTYDSALFGPAATLEVKGYDVGIFLNYSN